MTVRNSKLYDKTTLFTATTKANGRYQYHNGCNHWNPVNTMWMFAGTGDYERIND